ncbi:hypothetical protein Mal65_30150 [Crateriforma conspicua]|nr:hypothetical protein Mal65_30150 [Crateriforma conspicua]
MRYEFLDRVSARICNSWSTMRLILLLAICYSQLLGSLCCAQVVETNESGPQKTQDSRIPASFLNALISNNESIKIFDVKCRIEQTIDRPWGDISVSERIFRYQSTGSNPVLFVSSLAIDRFGASKADDDSRTRSIYGLQYTDNGRYLLVTPGNRKSGSYSDIDQVRKSFGIPEFSTLGINPFPFIDRVDDATRAFLSSLKTGAESVSSQEVGQKHVLVELFTGAETQSGLCTQWRFDRDTLMPDQRVVRVLTPEGTKGRVFSRTNYVWRSQNGVYVPVSLKRTEFQRARVGGEIKSYESYLQADFVWNHCCSNRAFKVLDLENVTEFDQITDLLHWVDE